MFYGIIDNNINTSEIPKVFIIYIVIACFITITFSTTLDKEIDFLLNNLIIVVTISYNTVKVIQWFYQKVWRFWDLAYRMDSAWKSLLKWCKKVYLGFINTKIVSKSPPPLYEIQSVKWNNYRTIKSIKSIWWSDKSELSFAKIYINLLSNINPFHSTLLSILKGNRVIK